MTKPIIDHYGRYVAEPEHSKKVYMPIRESINTQIWDNGRKIYLTDEFYATREAAEMALIRAKCLQRLKEMAYGGGWLPLDDVAFQITLNRGGGIEFTLPVFFQTPKLRDQAYWNLSDEERAAFLYVYKAQLTLERNNQSNKPSRR